MQVDNFNEAILVQKLSEAKLTLPCIVKPQVACGVSDAHKMVSIYLFSFIITFKIDFLCCESRRYVPGGLV